MASRKILFALFSASLLAMVVMCAEELPQNPLFPPTTADEFLAVAHSFCPPDYGTNVMNADTLVKNANDFCCFVNQTLTVGVRQFCGAGVAHMVGPGAGECVSSIAGHEFVCCAAVMGDGSVGDLAPCPVSAAEDSSSSDAAAASVVMVSWGSLFLALMLLAFVTA